MKVYEYFEILGRPRKYGKTSLSGIYESFYEILLLLLLLMMVLITVVPVLLLLVLPLVLVVSFTAVHALRIVTTLRAGPSRHYSIPGEGSFFFFVFTKHHVRLLFSED